MASVNLPVLAPGTVFRERYRIVRIIKAGGQGAVYEAKDESTNRPRALKVMLPSLVEDDDMRARFALEARVTGDIESDHLVRISDVGIDEASGAPFMVMDLLRGEDLQTTSKSRGPLPHVEVVDYLMQTARVLDKTHAANIVHRDIKPDNLFITRRDDGSPCVKILDFGIAKVIAQANAKKTRALGTPLYMAPEQIRGDARIGPSADIYSLAHVAYALLTGRAYWTEEAQADPTLAGLLMKILAGAEEPASARALRCANVRLPAAFDAWFQRATAVAAQVRFESALALVMALESVFVSDTDRAPEHAPPAPLDVHAGQTTAVASGPTQVLLAGQTQAHYAGQPYPHAAAPGQPAAWGPQTGPLGPPGHGASQAASTPAKSSFPLVPVLGCLGGGVVFVLLVVFVAALGSDPEKPSTSQQRPDQQAQPQSQSQSKSQGSVDCGAAAACLPTQVADVKHADATALLPSAKKLAQRVDVSVKLLSITAPYTQRDGTTDLTGNRSISYVFVTDKGGLVSVAVMERLTSAVTLPPNPALTHVVPEPHCSVKQVVAAAIAGGFPIEKAISVNYQHDMATDEARWMVFDQGRMVHVDGKTCK